MKGGLRGHPAAQQTRQSIREHWQLGHSQSVWLNCHVACAMMKHLRGDSLSRILPFCASISISGRNTKKFFFTLGDVGRATDRCLFEFPSSSREEDCAWGRRTSSFCVVLISCSFVRSIRRGNGAELPWTGNQWLFLIERSFGNEASSFEGPPEDWPKMKSSQRLAYFTDTESPCLQCPGPICWLRRFATQGASRWTLAEALTDSRLQVQWASRVPPRRGDEFIHKSLFLCRTISQYRGRRQNVFLNAFCRALVFTNENFLRAFLKYFSSWNESHDA